MTISDIAFAVFTGADDPEPDPPEPALFELPQQQPRRCAPEPPPVKSGGPVQTRQTTGERL